MFLSSKSEFRHFTLFIIMIIQWELNNKVDRLGKYSKIILHLVLKEPQMMSGT